MENDKDFRHLVSIVIFLAGVAARTNMLALLLLIFIIEKAW